MRRVSNNPTAQTKERIQALLRKIAIARDGGCFLRHYVAEAGQCGGYTKNGNLILQFDHLNTRARNISFADTRLGVCACQRHHIFWKKQHPALYEKLARHFIGKDRTKLLESVIADRRSYNFVLSDWLLLEKALEKELSSYPQ